jgi:hypothetical protein
MSEPVGFEGIVQQQCGELMDSKIAQDVPREQLHVLVSVAFAIGAAWAFDDPAILALAKRHLKPNSYVLQ